MIYFNDKKYFFASLVSPPEGVPIVIDSAYKMDEILERYTKKNFERVYYYIGQTTDKYIQYTYYMLRPEVAITTNISCTPFEIYDSDGVRALRDPLTFLPNGKLDIVTKDIVECISGYLFIKVKDGYDNEIKSISIRNGDLELIEDESNYKIIKVNTDGDVYVSTEKIIVPSDDPAYVVIIDAENINSGKFRVYDTDDNLQAREENCVAVFGGGKESVYAKAGVICKTGYLYFELDVTDAVEWETVNVTSGNMTLISSSRIGRLFKVNSDASITAVATTNRKEEETEDPEMFEHSVSITSGNTRKGTIFVYDTSSPDGISEETLVGKLEEYPYYKTNVEVTCTSGCLYIVMKDRNDDYHPFFSDFNCTGDIETESTTGTSAIKFNVNGEATIHVETGIMKIDDDNVSDSNEYIVTINVPEDTWGEIGVYAMDTEDILHSELINLLQGPLGYNGQDIATVSCSSKLLCVKLENPMDEYSWLNIQNITGNITYLDVTNDSAIFLVESDGEITIVPETGQDQKPASDSYKVLVIGESGTKEFKVYDNPDETLGSFSATIGGNILSDSNYALIPSYKGEEYHTIYFDQARKITTDTYDWYTFISLYENTEKIEDNENYRVIKVTGDDIVYAVQGTSESITEE